jgi:hypothetical protein
MKPGDIVTYRPMSFRLNTSSLSTTVIYLSIFSTPCNKNNMFFVLANILYCNKLCQVFKHELYDII